jgi:hypothetical protein
MPQYFFHICNRNWSVFDRHGMQLPNQKAAESQAVVLAQTFRSGGPTPLNVIVTNADGTELYRTQVVG